MQSQNNKILVSQYSILNSLKAFTIVELIVVITILAILGTIGFISFSSHLVGTRDTSRLSQLEAIHSGLQVYQTNNRLPQPESSVEVRASGSLIGYQGYIGKDILSMIGYSKGGKDPKDEQYFTYYLTYNRKHFQLMAYLEDEGNKQVVRNIINQTNAINYSKRYSTVIGKKLGVLTESGTNLPIQEVSSIVSSGYLDIVTTTNSYNAIFTDQDILSGSGVNLVKLKNTPLDSFELDNDLVGYWDMETLTIDGNIADLSGNGYIGACYAGISTKVTCGHTSGPQIVDGNGKTGKAMYFDGVDDYIRVSDTNNLLNPNTHTILAFIKTTGTNGVFLTKMRTNYKIALLGGKATVQTVPSNHPTLPVSSLISDGNINDGKWYLITQVWNKGELKLYINGVLNKTLNTSNPSMKENSQDIEFGSYLRTAGCPTNCSVLNNSIDEIRFYNRALSDTEIKNIYNEIK